MAETVLSMASSMLKSAVSKAAAAAGEEISLLMGVRKDIWFMKDELETMQAFLEVPEVTTNKDKLVKVWAKQVRDLSYDIEDCLDEFTVHMGNKSLLEKLKKLKDRHRIAVQICSLKSRVEEVSTRNTRYQLIRTESSNNTNRTESCMEDIRNLSARNIDEAQLVGFATPKQKLLEMIDIHMDDGHDRVICVVGTGGLGKTTLARKIFDSKEDIAKNFSCCAWIVVSQSFVMTDLLKEMIRQFFGAEALNRLFRQLGGNAGKVKDHLASYLTEGLTDKRYFIVLDDLWDIAAWKWINSIALPRNNSRGSRIIVTTRNVGLAEECTCESLIYHLEPLGENDAVELLLMKTLKTQKDMESNENLRNMVKRLVKKCGYLPLAIVTLGGILASKKIEEWAKFYKKIPSELESNPSLEAMRRMVMLSYNHLPSHLKPCFLYLSIFPEDFEIKRSHLVERWIAEGLFEARLGMTIEDVGVSYFDELISRSMIIPSKVNIEGIVNRCRVHDIMRDIIVLISREENFVYATGDNVPSAVDKNFRHVAYHGDDCTTLGMDWSHVRSLTFFGDRPTELANLLCSPQMRMLRVFDLEKEDFAITQKDLNNLGLLRHLKYVSTGHNCRPTYVYTLPRSIGSLQGLQFLDIRWGYISTLPTEISQLKSLRSLRIGTQSCTLSPIKWLGETLRLPVLFTPFVNQEKRNETTARLYMVYSSRWSPIMTYGVKFPRGIGNLKELQILEVVDIKRTSCKAIEELGDLIGLRKLHVTAKEATEKKCKILCKAIQKLPSLGSLHVSASHDGTVEWLDSVSSLPSLRSLYLVGLIGDKVDWFRNLTQLVKLRLWASRLEDGKTMEILGALPKLRLLRLGYDTYVGNKLVFKQGAFLNLRNLHIWDLEKLRKIVFEQGSMPEADIIIIGLCKLESGINGIKYLPKLKNISLSYRSKVARLGMLQEEVDAHHNKPVLRLEHHRSEHDLGDTEGSDDFFEAMESLPDQAEESSQAITQTASGR